MFTGMDLKVQRIKARVSATQIAAQMGVVRQRISQIEALAIVPDDTAERYRTALLSVTEGVQKPEAVA